MKVFTCAKSARTLLLSQISQIVRIVILTLIAGVLFLTLSPIAIAQTVHIPDTNLRASLEVALGKEVGADITQTDMASLEVLDAFESGISNLSGLEFAVNLTELHLGLNRISDVSLLKGLVKLTVLDLHRNQIISDVSSLKNLTKLIWLSLRGNRISDVSPLKDLTKLAYLHIGYNRISDVSPFKDLATLTFLNLDANKITDVSPLKDLTNLTELHLDDNTITDVSPLKDLTNLTFLNVNDNKITELLPLKDLTNLTSLNLHGNGLSDVSYLKDLTNLRILRLHENQISDVSALKDLTNLGVLQLHENQISDVSALKDLTKLTKLDLHSNEISDVSALKDMINLTVLDLSDNHISDFSPLDGLIGNLKKYDTGNQDQTTPLIKPEDVNRDGIVNVADLILVALNYRNPDFNIYLDVNGDGIVDVVDLVAVAVEIDTEAAAPTLKDHLAEISNFTAEQLTQWIQLANRLKVQGPQTRKGIIVLEQLLAALSLAEKPSKETALLANYPNPFNPETWIPYQLARPAEVNIFIHSADGKLVRTLELGQLPAGVYHRKSHAAYWDGRNELEETVASGVYFYTLTADDFTATGKMFIRK